MKSCLSVVKRTARNRNVPLLLQLLYSLDVEKDILIGECLLGPLLQIAKERPDASWRWRKNDRKKSNFDLDS